MKFKQKLRAVKSAATIFSLVCIITSTLVFQGCEKDELFYEEYNLTNTIEDITLKSDTIYPSDWKEQLTFLKNNKSDLLRNNEIRLINYHDEGLIHNEQDLVKIKNKILEKENVMPSYNGSLTDITPRTIHEMQINLDQLKKFLEKNLFLGQRKIRLHWQYQDQKFETICIVSDIEGIVYDHFITNIIIINIETTSA